MHCISGTLGRLSRERLASVIGNIVDILSRDAAVLKRLPFFSMRKHIISISEYFGCRYEPNLRDAGLWVEESSAPVVPLSAITN